jgi:hypothetical protein
MRHENKGRERERDKIRVTENNRHSTRMMPNFQSTAVEVQALSVGTDMAQ